MYRLDYYTLFFFKQKTAYEMRSSDWSSDVCSSDLEGAAGRRSGHGVGPYPRGRRQCGGGRARDRRRAGKDTTGVRRRREPADRPRQRKRARARFGRTDRTEIGRQLRNGGPAVAGADARSEESREGKEGVSKGELR